LEYKALALSDSTKLKLCTPKRQDNFFFGVQSFSFVITKMYDLPRKKLCELLDHYGIIIIEDAERCESLLRNACGDEYKRAIFVLVNAIREGVVKEISNLPQSLLNDEELNRLAQHLHENLWLDKSAADWAVESWALALKGKKQFFEKDLVNLPSPAQAPTKALSPINPLDYLRLLWWVFNSPQQLQAYWQVFGQEDEKRVGNWLVSTLIWWPLLVSLLILEQSLTKIGMLEIYIGLTVGCWILTGWFKINQNMAISLAFLMSICLTVLVSVSVANIVMAGFLWLSLIVGVAVIMASLIAVIVAGDVAVVVAVLVSIGVAIGIAVGVALLLSDFMVGLLAGSAAGLIAAIVMEFVANVVGDAIKNTLITGIPSFLARLAFVLLIVTHLSFIGLYLRPYF